MSKIPCQTISYLPAHQCELDGDGIVIPKTGFEFIDITSREKLEFTEDSKIDDGNNLYEQSITFINLYDDNSLLTELDNSHLIIYIEKLSGDKFIWGSLEPYNPVQVAINTNNKVAELNFYRIVAKPEYS